MKTSIDMSLYPLTEDYIPAIKEFIDRVSAYEGVAVKRNDLSTQLFGDYDQIMDLLKVEIKRSWQTHGKGIFVVKFLLDDLRGLADD
ncbi:MAG: YkoF family thiamine/hydroxymethylpyrimidine-binding protein [Pseudomonadales bacterium]|jgi:uncharacterized protein YqgV (UPF0045/DUF77 family)